ncbi:hypothetical protein B0H16DRAFT_233196 [Mycena metata]|uniref:NACHT domain-containing protein n=1 Tax=Mycena metata TaxID=1033252 RepID=A0AAD7HV62_9AGAR|nr:hypothetical protein B0H16DRAFT_233196 [Mycena metata]
MEHNLSLDLHSKLTAGERDKIIEYLSPVNFFTRQADIYGTRQPGTGSELLEHNHFKQWKDSMDRKILRCCGMPGVGKTVLVSMVVEQLRTEFRHKNVGVACIYLDHKEIQSHSLPNLFAALWQQLVFEIPIAAGSPVHRLYQEHHEKRTRPTLAQSYELLTTIISKLSQVFILVDALDEYPEDQRNVLLKYLTDINDPPIKLLLAARPNISLSFPNITTVNISGSQKDIRKYLHQKITESKHLSSHVKKSPELRREIITKILDAVGGMFLLARLHIGSLATATEPKDVREALENLQRDLPLVYADIMQRIDSQDKGDRQLAHSVLTWVANAKRPLLVGELREALATQLRSEVNINGILSVCAGLVTVDNIHNPIVRLIHHTTQTYLDSIQETHFPRAQTDITLTCLTYLSSKDISTLNCFSYFEKQDFLRQHQLIGYAQYWLLHARGQPEKDLQKEIVVFLETASEWYRFWSTLDPREYVEPWDYTWHAGLTLTPFWFSASSNLLHITKSLLVQTPYISEEMQSSVLYGAAYYHHLHMLQLLLENGLNVNARGHYGTVLHIASYWGLEEIVRLLIRYGADVNIQGGPCGTALGAALYQAHDRNQTLHLASPDAQTPQNYETIIQILIYHGANGNLNIVQSDSYNSYAIPLHAASQGGSREIVGGLIRNEANINFEGQSETAHHAVAHVGFTDIVQVGMPLDPLPPPPPQVAQPPTLHDLYKAIYSVEVPKSNTATSCSVPLDNWNVIRSLAAALLQKPETPADLDTSISTKLDALASKLDSISSQIPQPTPTSGSILHKTYTSVAASHPATYTARERSCDVILTPKDRLNKVFTIETPHAIQQQLNTVIMGSPRLNKHTQVPFVRATAKHRNGDIRLTLQSSHAAALLMEEVDHWLPTFSSLLQLRTLTFPIIMHRVPTSFNIGSGLPSHADEWESDIAVLVKANETYMNTGDLARVHWISRQTSDELRKAKQHSSLVLHFKSADAANKCITHKLALYGHLHRTEKYYPQPQCFNCYCFGHTASQCRHL